MSLVSPVPQSTSIKLYKGIPWDSSMENIRWFSSQLQRNIYLGGKIAGTWDNCSVVNPGKSIRLQGLLNNMIDCNYMSFVNANLGTTSRTYYAWVISVDYVNAQTVEITYEIDWIQTYLFDFQFEACLVEREHVNSDEAGKWLMDEHLETGEYLIQSQHEQLYTPAVMVNVLKDNFTAAVVNNIYQAGVTYVCSLANSDGLAQIASLLEEYNAKPERITYFGMCVAEMGTFLESSGSSYFVDSFTVESTGTFTAGSDSYTPHNKKLLTYPYRLLTADNYNGQSVQYRWELNNPVGTGGGINSMDFQVNGMGFPKPVLMIQPRTYRNSNVTEDLTQEGLSYDNFPMVAYATDAFKAWVSEFGVSRVASRAADVTTTSFSMVGNALSLNWGAIGGNMNSLAQSMIKDYQDVKSHQIHSVQAHGGTAEAGIHFGMGNVGFRVTQYGITPQRAREIDRYFDRYGYRVDTVKIPNITGRKYVNYVKCGNGHVAGNVATDAKLAMEKALTRGTAFWHVDNIDMELTDNPIV